MNRCHGRKTGPRCAALRMLMSPFGGTGVIIALKCQMTNRSYVRTGAGGPGTPNAAVLSVESSRLRRLTP